MIELFSNEFWIAVLFVFQFFFVVFLFVLVKRINRLNARIKGVHTNDASGHTNDQIHNVSDDQAEQEAEQKAARSASNVLQVFEPLVRESRKTALRFEEQIKEKKRLIKELNNALDDRIININLLLSRAQTQHKKLEQQQNNSARQVSPPVQARLDLSSDQMMNQQHQIIQMYEQKLDIDVIAEKLSVPKGEVRMVIDLKKKFLEMEKDSR